MNRPTPGLIAYLYRRPARLAALLMIAGVCALPATGTWAAGGGGGRSDPQFKSASDSVKRAVAEGDYARAESAARDLYQRYRDHSNEHFAAAARFFLGRVLLEQGSYAEAEPLLRQALQLWTKYWGETDRRPNEARARLMRTTKHLGKLAEADALSRQVLEVQEKLTREGSPDHTRAVTQYAKVQRELGRHAEAEQAFKRALGYSQGTSDAKQQRFRTGTLEALGGMLREQKRFAEAERYARECWQLREQTHGPAHPETAKAIYLVGRILAEQERHDEAEPLLQRALVLHEQTLGPKHHQTGKVLASLAQAAIQRQQPQVAAEYLRRALEIARAAGVPTQLAHNARAYGRLLVRQQRAPEALPYYRESLDAVDALFAGTRGLGEEVRQDFIGQYAAYYREMLDLLLQLHRSHPNRQYDHEALAVVSRTQSRFFSELLRVADVNAFSTDSAFVALRDRQQQLQDRLDALSQAKYAREPLVDLPEENGNADTPPEPVPARAARLQRQILQTDSELKAVEDRLWREFPRYMELVRPRPVTVADLQKKLLRPGEALLTYALMRDTTVLFAVTPGSFRMHVEPAGREDIRRLVRTARASAEQAALGGSYAVLQSLDPAALHALYRGLVAPVGPALAGVSRVLVVGDGAIHTLPLEMLVTRYGEPERKAFEAARARAEPLLGEYATLPYLGDRYRLAYLPSLAALASQRQHPLAAKTHEKQLVSFADPVFEVEGPALAMADTTRAALTQLSRGAGGTLRVPRLPETADEAREIAATLGGTSELFLRERAQEKTIKAMNLKSTRYLHFATHGFLGGEFLALKESALDADPDAPAATARTLAVAPAGSTPPAAAADEPAHRPGGQPALALTLVGNLQGEDGLLTMKEVIEGLRLNAEMVVLSACNTAGEKAEANNGEGFAGLTRGFMYAGTRGLLVSHWSVESQSTKELIVDTFRHLKAGEAPVVALRRAREQLRHSEDAGSGQRVSRAHPYFWAPFVYVGD